MSELDQRTPSSPKAAATVLSIVSRLHPKSRNGTRSEHVSHQLRHGISIGLLQPGERLPSEEEMAHHFEVSPLTFRQSLERLRLSGLVITRPGRGGGTFISADNQTIQKLTEETLRALSVAEVLELADATAALFAETSRRAAMCFEDHDVAELERLVLELTNPETPVSRRRSATLFVIQVATMARNEYLLNAIIPLIGELQALVWFQDRQHLPTVLNEVAKELVQAISEGRPLDAANLAMAQAEELTKLVVQNKLFLDSVEDSKDSLSALSAGFTDLLTGLNSLQRALSDVALELERVPVPSRARKGSADDIDQMLKNVVRENRALIRGCGIAYAPGLIQDAPLWIDWWDSVDTESLAFKSHTFNRRSLQHYAYDRMPWYQIPQTTGSFSIYGPYIDRGGVEQKILTASLPVENENYAGSVVGADIDLSSVESIVLSHLGSQPMIVLNDENRVVVSSMSSFKPGSIIVESSLESLKKVEPQERVESFGWRMFTSD